MSAEQKCELVDFKDKKVSISQQCRLLNLSRSRLYYTPYGIPNEELRAMRLLDEL